MTVPTTKPEIPVLVITGKAKVIPLLVEPPKVTAEERARQVLRGTARIGHAHTMFEVLQISPAL